MLTLIRRVISLLIFPNIVKGYNGGSSLMKIKAAQFYVRGVKNLRILFLGVFFAMFSLVLLGSGLFLIHMALFTYSEWSFQAKFVTAFVLGGMELLGAIIILFYLFREENWIKFFGIQKVIKSVVEGKSGNKE
jgi:hypothetical protein